MQPETAASRFVPYRTRAQSAAPNSICLVCRNVENTESSMPSVLMTAFFKHASSFMKEIIDNLLE
jgi:hypothetical protein